MAWDWTVKAELQDDIERRYVLAYAEYNNCLSAIQDLPWDILEVDDPDARTVLTKLYNGLGSANLGLAFLLVHKNAQNPDYGIPYFLKNYTISESADEYELTWKKIIMAWSEISEAAMLWTIEGIDQMRQSIWNTNPKIKWNENPFE